MYPNPFTSVLNITLDNANLGSTLTIYNAAGAGVVSKVLSDKTSALQMKLPAGTYYYQLTGKNGKQQTGKIISKP